MNRKSLLQKKRMRAQSLVEFALVLPLLLLVIYGLLEVGRLIFTYSIVISASREAVRYGSATGLNIAGGVPRYKDCDGIRAAAQNVDFLGVIDDANITIVYDKGPGGASLGGCPPASVATGDRITVNVTAPFIPIVPLPIGPITARSFSARTIIVNLAVAGTALPPPTVPPPPPLNTPTFTATYTPLPTSTFTPTATNGPSPTASITPTPSLTFTPSMTFTPSFTPTITNTPTQTATPVNCTLVTHSPLRRSGNTLTMDISNLTGAALNVSQVLVAWNSGTGHTGADTTLRLRSIAIGGIPIWGGDSAGPSWVSSFLYASGVTLPTGSSNIVFTFHQSYDKLSSTDKITIQFYNNGCASYTLDSSAASSCSVAGVGAISDLTGTRGGGITGTLTWTPSLEDLGGTNIYLSINNITWELLGNTGSSIGTFPVTITGSNNTQDHFRVQPINSCSNAPYSNTATIVK